MQFKPEKTELIHFHNKRSPITTPLRIGALVITPKEVARYLGVWFDAKLSFKPHVEKRVTAVTAAFYGLQRLATTQRGLSFSAARRLYIACITSIADYGVQVWWRPNLPYNMVNKYQKLQNLATRIMLGAFRGAPTKALEVEAAIMPPEVRFKRLCNRSSLRVLFFNDIYPIKEARSYEAVDKLNAEEPVDLQCELRLIKPITQLLALLKRLEQVKHYNTVEKLYTSEETP